jgi:hypothetical protein
MLNTLRTAASAHPQKIIVRTENVGGFDSPKRVASATKSLLSTMPKPISMNI